jgi:hypothetical protein
VKIGEITYFQDILGHKIFKIFVEILSYPFEFLDHKELIILSISLLDALLNFILGNVLVSDCNI